MEFVQTRIDYHFADIQLLESALKAAHRDRENENTDDGNRGLARIGLLAIEMAETYNAIVVENLTINDANSREHWWKNKKSRAKLCELLGIGSCIKQSIRQGDLSPSTAVLDHALSALFGAVWLDCENQGKSANETRNTISKVLHHINASVNEPRFAVNDWNRTLVEKNSLWNPLAEETTGGLMQEDCVNITTDDTHSLALDSIVNIYVDELGYAENQSFLDNFPMFGNQNLFMGNFQVQGQGSTTQSTFSAMDVMDSNDPKTNRQPIQLVAHDRRPGNVHTIPPDGQFAENGGCLQKVLVTGFKRKRIQNNEDRATSTYNFLLESERQKLSKLPELERIQLERYLRHPEIDQLDDSSPPFRFLYLTIGSSQTLIDFSDQLRAARETQNNPEGPSQFPSNISETFNIICHLESEEANCLLLKRYHAIKLLEEEEEHQGVNDGGILIETAETMSTEGPVQMGNPTVIREAALIDKQTSKIRPDAQPGSKEFSVIRRRVKRIRQLAKRLRRLTTLYGMGILALLPSGPSFSGFSLTDAVLRAMTEERFSLFTRLLHREQGPLLKRLSEAVAPALKTLATFSLGYQMEFGFESTDLRRLKDVPKAALSL